MLNKIIYTILGFSLAFVFFPHAAKDSARQPLVSGAATAAETSPGVNAPELAYNSPAPILTAKAGLAYDLDSGTILYSKNLDEKLPIASITKLMTALVAVNKAKLADVVTVEPRDQTSIGSIIGVVAGEQLTVHDLLKALLIPSANDAALTLANHIAGSAQLFAAQMNEEARVLGLNSTHFANPVGWDSDENYSTTLDLIKIVQEFLLHPELAEIVRTKEANISSVDGAYIHKLSTTNKLLLDNPEVQGIKTGFTSKALGNLVILDNHNGRRIVTIVLGSDNREEDTQKMLTWLFAVYKW